MRKNAAPKRPVVKDPVYNSEQVTMLVNKILQDGKKSTAERIVYGALEACREKTGTDPVGTLEKALGNIRPDLEVRSRRVGGATYQVPVEVKPARANTLALRWLVTFTRQRRENTMIDRLANEILDASNGLGASVKRREDTHRWQRPTAPSPTTAGSSGTPSLLARTTTSVCTCAVAAWRRPTWGRRQAQRTAAGQIREYRCSGYFCARRAFKGPAGTAAGSMQ